MKGWCRVALGLVVARFLVGLNVGKAVLPRGSRYQIIEDLGPKSHNNHGLQALIP